MRAAWYEKIGPAEDVLQVGEMRHSAIQLQQVEGRCHRDGQRALIYYAFAEETIEERIAATVVTRMAAMDGMAGDDTSVMEEIARVIEAAMDPSEGCLGKRADQQCQTDEFRLTHRPGLDAQRQRRGA